MKLKEGLILREVAGQFVIVPTGKMVLDIPQIHYMSKDAALLWQNVYNKEFEKDDLVQILKEYFPQAPIERMNAEADNFIEGVRSRMLLEKEQGGVGHVYYHIDSRKIPEK